jgi:NAD(P)-dependent dehydrogenase (short-subunit alcohol dehydrogenase family)
VRVLVLGGSSGIGLATARACVARGWTVVVASRNPAGADVDAERIALDVTDRAAVDTVLGGLGPVDHLVFTPGSRASGPAKELDLDVARRAFETKLWGALAAIQAADVRRSIVLMSGAAASTPMRGGAATAAVNGAVEALVRVLAVELAPVRVNAVSPGIVDTPSWAALDDVQRRAMFDRLSGNLPAGRVGRAEDIAAAIVSMLENDFLTGEVLHVDGGHRLAAP